MINKAPSAYENAVLAAALDIDMSLIKTQLRTIKQIHFLEK